MTVLPIVERELRVAARRSAAHWTRFCAALATLCIWFLLALSTPQSVPVAQVSKNLFWFLLGLGIDLVLGLLAKRRLQRRFREIASGPLSKETRVKRSDAISGLSFGQRSLNTAQP